MWFLIFKNYLELRIKYIEYLLSYYLASFYISLLAK